MANRLTRFWLKQRPIVKELYLGAVVDRSSRRVVFMASTEGGVEIEKVAEETPHLIHKVALDPLTGPMPYQGRELAFKLGLEGKLVQQFTKIFMGLATIFLERDLALIEINPLVITKQGDLICLDGKLGADGNALFRQPDLREMRDQSQEDPREAQAAQWELNYVALDGNIGVWLTAQVWRWVRWTSLNCTAANRLTSLTLAAAQPKNV